MNVNIKKICVDYFNRMKYYCLLSLVIFTAFLLLSYFYPSFFSSIMSQALQNMRDGVTNGQILLETSSLFINNFTVAFNIYTSGIFFSIPSIYLLAYNAAMVGYTGASLPLNYFLAYTLPHGVCELTAIILSGAASFRLGHGYRVGPVVRNGEGVLGLCRLVSGVTGKDGLDGCGTCR